jgi:hypothetical protein
VNQLDYIRVLALTVAFVTEGFFIYALVRGVSRYKVEKGLGFEKTPVALLRGRLSEIGAVIILLVESMVNTADRFGEPHMDWRTPTLLVACILAMLAWGWLHRRNYVPSVIGAAVGGAIESDVPSESFGPGKRDRRQDD